MNESGTLDGELLRAYAEHGTEEAFATLVRRHANLVFSAARRQTPDAHTAADVTQTVFIILAQKAAAMKREAALVGWLLKTTYYSAANARRRELRRHLIEKEAMQYLSQTGSEPDWAQIAPLLDEALLHLGTKDHNAVALRYLEKKSYREIGATLGLSEDNARKRVDRALERLRAGLGKHGKIKSTAALGAAIADWGVEAAPPGLAATAARAAVAGRAGMGAALPALARETLRSLHALRWKAFAINTAGATAMLVLGLTAVHLTVASASSKDHAPENLSSPSNHGALPTATNAPAAVAANATPGEGLKFRVNDSSTGKPVAGVTLTLSDNSPDPKNVFWTDDNGEALLPTNGIKRPFWQEQIEVYRDGYVPKYVSWSARQHDQIADVPASYTTKLDPAVEIGGVVRNAKGEPVSGAKIVFSVSGPVSNDRERLTMMGDYHAEETDASGVWRCRHVPAEFGMIEFKVLHPDYMEARFGVTQTSESPGMANDGPAFKYLTASAYRGGEALMVLHEGIAVTGRVVDESGNPVAGASITEDRDWRGAFSSTTTGLDGKFQFHNGSEKDLLLTVEAGAFAPLEVTNHPDAAPQDQDLILSRGAALRGRVVDDDGTPIIGASISVAYDERLRDRFQWKTKSDTQGRFFWEFAPNSQQTYFVEAAGYEESSDVKLTADGTEHPIKLSRSREAGPPDFSGSVVDAETHRPIDSFEVFITGVNGPFTLHGRGEMAGHGKNGKFSCKPNREQSSYLMEVDADGYWPVEVTNSGAQDISLHFELHRADDITGLVKTPDGTPAVGAVALLCTERGNAYMSLPGQFDLTRSGALHIETDSNGMFRFKPKAGIERIRISDKSGFAEATVEELAASKTVTLQPWGRVEGTLKIAGAPASNEVVCLRNWFYAWHYTKLSIFLETKTDADGHFEFNGVPPGEREVLHNAALREGDTKITAADAIPIKTGTSFSFMVRPKFAEDKVTYVQVLPAQTTHVDLGERGWTITGEVAPIDSAQPVDWQREMGCWLRSKAAYRSFPNRSDFAGDKEFEAAKEEWNASARAYDITEAGREWQRRARQYAVIFDSAGRFRINDVAPGAYWLNINSGTFGTPSAGHCSKEIIVPELSGGGESQPMDLGAMQLEPANK